MQAAAAKMSGARAFDVTVWGATGFTGRLVCEHLARDYAVRSRHQEVEVSINQGAADHTGTRLGVHVGQSAMGNGW